MAVQCNTTYFREFIGEQEIAAIFPEVQAAHDTLHGRTGLGSEYLGWLDLPAKYDRQEFARIKETAARIRAQSEIVIVIGIGGSYLGSRAVIEGLLSVYHNQLPNLGPQIYFAGNSLHPSSINHLMHICKGKELSVIVSSKSGNTTETVVAFRFFRDLLERRYGKDGAKERIFCLSEQSPRSTLKRLSNAEGYMYFPIPEEIGGRYSVLTAVGLLPIAAAGCDIDALMNGARDAHNAYTECSLENHCYRYAAVRHLMGKKGKTIEVLAAYDPDLAIFGEWYKQLFGESQGKDGKGIFPASMIFSTDLHSLGQYIQDGPRTLFETVLDVQKPQSDRMIPISGGDLDGLNFLFGQSLDSINHKAFQGALLAHLENGTPNIVLSVPRLDAYEFGWLIYFFEKACAISSYMLGINPFDQPGVENYKNKMFALLGKPGYEEEQATLEARL